MSGGQARGWIRFRFLTVPVWMRILVLPALLLRLGLVHRLLARVVGESASGWLPVTRAWWWAFQVLRGGGPALFTLALGLFLLALFSSAPEAYLAGSLGALFGALLMGWVAWPAIRPRARVRRRGGEAWVELRGVHPLFAEGVQRAYDARRSREAAPG